MHASAASIHAPIALFVFNRPEHTRRTLEALAANDFAAASTLYVFCDGPHQLSVDADRARIDAVRSVVRSRKWCGEVIIDELDANLGLARSIRRGVDSVLDSHDRVIVLEDDIETSIGFLGYMNEALHAYRDIPRVRHIAAYLPRTSYQWMLPDSFLSGHMSCWGWATWRDRWNRARWDAAELLRELDSAPGGRRKFDLDGTADFSNHLERNVTGDLSTWAVLWAASIHLEGGLCLLPGRSLVNNIGTDGSGVHFRDGPTDRYDVEPAADCRVVTGLTRENRRGRSYLRSFYRYGHEAGVGKRLVSTALSAARAAAGLLRARRS